MNANAMSTRVATAPAPAKANQENVAPASKETKADPPAQDAAKKKRCARASRPPPHGPHLGRARHAVFLRDRTTPPDRAAHPSTPLFRSATAPRR